MPASKAHIKANIKYESKAYDKILIRVRKDGELTRADIQAAADQAGKSLNQYIIDAVTEKMAK